MAVMARCAKRVAVCELSPADRATVEFIRVGFRQGGCLEFMANLSSLEAFQAACHAIRVYHRFDGARAARTLEPIFGGLMCVQVGRSNSPVMEFSLPAFVHQERRSRHMGAVQRIEPAERVALAQRLTDWAHDNDAYSVAWRDDISHTGFRYVDGPGALPDNPDVVRVWWD